jgi:hypothetical protein
MKKRSTQPSTTSKPETAAADQRVYSPELSSWFEHSTKSPGTFEIRSVNADGRTGPLIATVTVNPAFNPANAKAIVRLIASAPDLWQSLQNVAPHSLSDAGRNDDFANAMDTLWQAAGRFPFAWPKPEEREEKLMQANTAQVESTLA